MDFRAYDWIAKHAARQPEKTACIHAETGRVLSYRAFDERARRLASFLTGSLGVGRGDRVAVLARNSPDHLVVQNACVKIGALSVPLNWRLAPRELGAQLANAEPRVLLHCTESAESARTAAQEGGVGQVLDWGPDGTGGEYERGIRAADARVQGIEAMLSEPCALLYTSGATGLPKGVIVTHAMLFFNVVNYGMIVRVHQTSVQLCSLPLFHTGGLSQGASPALHAGGTVVVTGKSDPAWLLELVSDPRLGITHMMGVPANYQEIAAHPDFERADLSRIVAAAVGGSPVPLALHDLWRRRGVSFQEGYGLTEGGPSVLISEIGLPPEKVGSAGRPVIHGEIRLVATDGRDAGDEEIGEIWIRGPSVTPGYWRNPAATRDAFTDGWFRTGDAARRDADGYYYIVDRWKDMYISGGENVYPAEIENVLYAMEEVAEAAVIGMADEKWGEVGCAAIVRRPGRALNTEQVLEHCNGRLARYKIPKRIVFLDSLPRNAVGKVVKSALRNELAVGALVRK